MIGQINAKEVLSKCTRFPFLLLLGEAGSGKKTLLREVYPHAIVLPDIRVETIRKILVDGAYQYFSTTFIVPDADDMSINAKNAILKISEEPPNNNKFIMTLQDLNNTLPTIRSRAVVINMDRYSPKEIFQYACSKSSFPNEIEYAGAICDTPGQVNTLFAMRSALDFRIFVEKVVDNIAYVSDANALKISDSIALKDEEDKYNLKLFWKAFIKAAFEAGNYNAVKITSKCIQDLRIKGINRQMLFDSWVLGVRECWEECNGYSDR